MIEFRSLRSWLVLATIIASGCSSSSPLVWSAADELDDDDDEVLTEVPNPPPPPSDAGQVPVVGMDSSVVGEEPKKPPCGSGPGCDPTDLGGESCESLGAGSGKLLCDTTTCLFELGLCDGLPRDASVGRPCGTGPGCNTDDLGGETCSSLGMQSGVLGCDPETCQFDTSLCGPGGGNGGAGALFGGGNGGGGTGGFFGGGFFGGDDEDAGI